MQATQLNLLNIGLMLISTVIAFVLPFELFLFSYAVLGPLHYLTEISWLHQRNYFVKGKFDYLWLILLALFGSLSYFGFKNFDSIADFVPYVALLSALSFLIFKDWYLKTLAIIVIFISAAFLNDTAFYLVFFLIFLPTIIHVFLFTGSFILYGALKTRSVSGIISLFVFIGCALSFFLYNPDINGYAVNDYIRNSYEEFTLLNIYLIDFFHLGDLKEFENMSAGMIFSSGAGITVMRFIAFAYTYHYLNWFSKTSVIKWHKVDKKYLIATVLIWLSAVGIYAADYRMGLKFLFFLSFMHVFLEFPLNCKTFIEIGKEIKGLRFSQFSTVKEGINNPDRIPPAGRK